GPAWLGEALGEEVSETLRPFARPGGEAAVLDGSFVRAGDRIRVTANLTRADGHRYWTRTFERPLADLPGDISASIAPQSRPARPRRTPAAAAVESYFEGRHLLRRDDIANAAAALERATDADPEFALAWAWLSIA